YYICGECSKDGRSDELITNSDQPFPKTLTKFINSSPHLAQCAASLQLCRDINHLPATGSDRPPVFGYRCFMSSGAARLYGKGHWRFTSSGSSEISGFHLRCPIR